MNDDARKKIFEEFKEMIRTETVVGQPIYLRSRRRQNEPYGGSDYERRTGRIILH